MESSAFFSKQKEIEDHEVTVGVAASASQLRHRGAGAGGGREGAVTVNGVLYKSQYLLRKKEGSP